MQAHEQPGTSRARSLPLDTATLDAVLDSILAAMPAPKVMALAESGLRIPLPAGVPVSPEQSVTSVGSPLELCMPGDFGPIVDAWQRTRQLNAAQVPVHLRSDPNRTCMLHFYDARHRYGVYLAIIVSDEGELTTGDVTPVPRFCTIDRDALAVILRIDEATTSILGWTPEELIGLRTIELIHPDDQVLATANWIEMLGRHGAVHRVVARYRTSTGKYIWFECTNRNLLKDPAYGFVQTELLDVSERMDAVEALRASEQLLRRLTETLPLGIVQIDTERRIVYRNERLTAIAGVGAADTIDEQLACVAPADRAMLDAAIEALLGASVPADVELTIVHATEPRRCAVGMRALNADNGAVTGAILTISDITERVRMHEELQRRARYDDLTRCHNRASILEELEAVLGASATTGTAVLFIDLDGFKQVNDRYGHATGDELLKRTAERLLHCVRGIDLVGRLGGDEFLIVCPEVASPQEALVIAQRVAAALAARVALESVLLVPGSSIGVAWTNGRTDTDSFVARADAAMYESKRGRHEPVLHVATEDHAGIPTT